MKAGLARNFTAGEPQNLELVIANLSGLLLLLNSQLPGFFTGPELVTCFAIRAHEHTGAKVFLGNATPEFKGTRGDEFKIIKMRVNAKDFHEALACSERAAR